MDDLLELIWNLIRTSVMFGVIPGIIAYFVERSRLNDGKSKFRHSRKLVLIAGVLFCAVLAAPLFSDQVAWTLVLFGYPLSCALVYIALGIWAAWIQFQRKSS